MIKVTADLIDSDTDEFEVQLVGTNGQWTGVFYMTFSRTIAPWLSHRVKKHDGIVYSDATTASEAAKAIKKAYPDHRIRVIQRNTIIEETFVGEIK